MDKTTYRVLRAFCMWVFLISIVLFLKTKDQHFWIGLYFTTAMLAKMLELILWIIEPEK